MVGTATLGCAPSGADDVAARGSRLDPDFKPGKGKHRVGEHGRARGAKPAAREGERDAKGERRDGEKTKSITKPAASSPSSTPTNGPSKSSSSSPTKSAPTTSGPAPSEGQSASTTATPTTGPTPAGSASVSDPRGDVRGGLTGAPAHADAVGAVVTRTAGGFEVRIQVAGALPQVWDGSNVENIVAFFDVDLDGQVDYETWGHLAEDGWSASARRPDGASFGAASGVTATPSGDTLVLSFPASVVGGATSFQWSVATEFGSLTQVASGTTATDFAPDSGGVRFPA
ncbi:hypothetical protein CF8_3144 [Nocardioides sp. CF8]|nr:hypothetical protein CF8_3144 [Nocardioides sp. CF8]